MAKLRKKAESDSSKKLIVIKNPGLFNALISDICEAKDLSISSAIETAVYERHLPFEPEIRDYVATHYQGKDLARWTLCFIFSKLSAYPEYAGDGVLPLLDLLLRMSLKNKRSLRTSECDHLKASLLAVSRVYAAAAKDKEDAGEIDFSLETDAEFFRGASKDDTGFYLENLTFPCDVIGTIIRNFKESGMGVSVGSFTYTYSVLSDLCSLLRLPEGPAERMALLAMLKDFEFENRSLAKGFGQQRRLLADAMAEEASGTKDDALKFGT